ncbi:E3 ubiquitin-protein ligase rnf146 isoform X2 [Eupeodes corollae]|uniref:E3 ubiquitin-protein ligase rnf146 isoform X2 n=1 Tax=Eupeodes corollae TaxID=290404 RepID=UPI002492F73D|nr:E3 ubiquitin-protein ligase rnf146 isoform X2 [Eupeodes corollae]
MATRSDENNINVISDESDDDNIIIINDEDGDSGPCPSSSISSETNLLPKHTESDVFPEAVIECPICLQTCIHPARLPCGHIFCFLCVKGVAYKNRRCAMCRREIPPEFLDHPQLVNGIQDICKTKTTEDGYQWFYEGRNGWWQYDDRTSQDIEEAYKKGEKSCTILVAGYVYVVDFEGMLQQRQNEPSRRRHVKRDLASIPKKGVAGLRIEGNTVATDTNFASQVYHSRQMGFNSIDDANRAMAAAVPSIGVGDFENHLLHLHTQSHRPLSQQLSMPGSGGVGTSSSASDFISTVAATDAAIRIASDIIGSTLAHADEISRLDASRQLNSNSNRSISPINSNGNSSNNNSSSSSSGMGSISIIGESSPSSSSQHAQEIYRRFALLFEYFNVEVLSPICQSFLPQTKYFRLW